MIPNRAISIRLIFFLLFLLGHFAGAVDQDQNEYLYARKLFDEGYFDLAAEQLERVLRDNPGFELADEAQFLLGESYLKTKQFDKARAAFLRIAIVFTQSPLAPESMEKVGVALDSLGRSKEAAQAYERVFKFYPESPLATKNLSRAMQVYLASEDTSSALAIADKIIDKYAHSEAADAARIMKARVLKNRSQLYLARNYLDRVASRTSVDSLAAEANLLLGSIFRTTQEYDSAIDVLLKALECKSKCIASQQAAINLADLLNFRGLPDEALISTQPLLKDDNEFYAIAALKTGDSYYLKADYKKAYEFYQKSSDPIAKLKAAWSSEKSGDLAQAYKIYKELTSSKDAIARKSLARAAQVAQYLNKYRESKNLWWKIINGKPLSELHYRSYLELILLYLEFLPIDSLSNVSKLAAIYDQDYDNFLSDDIRFYKAKSYEKAEYYPKAVDMYEEFIEIYPASQYRDSAKVALNFIRTCHLRSPDLFEKMAELSSRSPNTVDRTIWALNWGDFYLEDFKDQVKAIDQYEAILQDTLFKDEVYLNALYKTGIAYLRLYWKAINENDTLAMRIYHDSTAYKAARLEELSFLSDDALELRTKLSMVNLRRNDAGAEYIERWLESAKSAFEKYGLERISPLWILKYIETVEKIWKCETAEISNSIDYLETIPEHTDDPETVLSVELSKIRLSCLNVINDTTYNSNDTDTLFSAYLDSLFDRGIELIDQSQTSLTAANFLWWLMQRGELNPGKRLNLLNRYISEYPYNIIQPEVYLLSSEIYSLLNRPLEALQADETAREYINWGKPDLDIFEIPNEKMLFQRGWAYFQSDSIEIAASEFRLLLNLSPESEYAPASLLYLAKINAYRGMYSAALAYLDTLETRFPYSKHLTAGEHLTPRLEMLAGNFETAFIGFQKLIDRTTNSDSMFFFSVQAAVCLYRQNKLDEALRSAKTIYKTFEDRDLDEIKALFYLEKGKSLDRSRQFEDARDQYERIVDKYPFSEWADDAEFSLGQSYILQNKYEQGVAVLNKFLENRIDSELRVNAKYSIGLSQMKLENYSEAVSKLKEVWNDAAGRELWLDVFVKLSGLYKNLNFLDAAIMLNREYLQRFPRAPDAIDRKMDIAQLYLQLGEYDQAIQQYRPLLPFADAEREAEIQFYIGEAYENKSDFQTALLEYLKVPILGRKTKLDWGITAVYRAGMCYEKLGDSEGAARMYRQIIQQAGAASNYGVAAQKRLDELNKN